VIWITVFDALTANVLFAAIPGWLFVPSPATRPARSPPKRTRGFLLRERASRDRLARRGQRNAPRAVFGPAIGIPNQGFSSGKRVKAKQKSSRSLNVDLTALTPEGSRAAVAARLIAQPVYPQFRKYPVRSVAYASGQERSSN